MENSGLSASDVLALTKENDGLLGGSSGFIILILFLLMMSGGFGFGGNNALQNSLTRAELYEGLNAQNTFSDLRSLQSDLNSGFANLNQSMCNGFNGVQLGFAGLSQNLCNGFNGIQSSIADTNYRMADCCCQIKQSIADDGEKTRNLIQQNEIQMLRDQLQDAKNENLATGLIAAQGVQTQNIMDFMRKLVNGGCCSC